jgi:threonine synthase
VIFVPATAPPAKLTQIVMYGAQIVPVNGRYDDAFALSMKATERWGYYNRNTAFNPLTIEGKKTVVFELYDQLGRVVPDYVFAPLGDGVVVSGVFKGFEDLLKLGIIEKMPVIVGVQAAGSPNVFNNIGADVFTSVPSKTIADSISVDVPGNFFMTVDYLKKYSGECLTVTDEEILAASSLLARTSGIFTEPASAAAFAGMLRYMEEGRFMRGSKNVVLLTGSGLKDLRSVQPAIRIPDAIDNDILAVERYLNKKK